MRQPAPMQCLHCGCVAVPDTWIPGSDLFEVAAWCCLGVPGLLYCLLRHLLRTKHCADCGSAHLMREARASRRSAGIDFARAEVASRDAAAWPYALRAPRARLRRGAPLAALGVIALVAGVLPAAAVSAPLALGHTAGLLGSSWVLVQIALFHPTPRPWSARDEAGREVDVDLA